MTREELLKIAKPILFNTDMVEAILEDRKTVTRRSCKDANELTVPDMSFFDADKRTYAVHNYADAEHTDKLSIAERTCPICPGDILYVRETWVRFECCCCEGDEHSGICINKPDEKGGCYMYRATNEIGGDARWHPSIHMPKEAARIFLKVKDVRVERLQDITEEQAIKEGIHYDKCPSGFTWKQKTSMVDCYTSAVGAFGYLWNSTIKKDDIDIYSWDANPWVWVIEFERIEPESEV